MLATTKSTPGVPDSNPAADGVAAVGLRACRCHGEGLWALASRASRCGP